MHTHNRSKNNTAANPGFAAKVRELLALTDEQLGLRAGYMPADVEYNRQKICEAVRKAAEALKALVNKEDPWRTGVPIQQQLWTPDHLIDGKNCLTLCEAQWVNGTYGQGPAGQRKLAEWMKRELYPVGCQGLETVTWRYDDPLALIEDDAVLQQYLDIHTDLGRVDVLSSHIWGQCVTDPVTREGHAGLLPAGVYDMGTPGSPFGVNYRAAVMMMVVPLMSKRLQLNDVTQSFLGGADLWQRVYDFGQGNLQTGFNFLTGMWQPIFDFFAYVRYVLGLEVHGTEAGFDYYSFEAVCEAFGNRDEFGAGHDRSHYVWQGIHSPSVVRAIGAKGKLYHSHLKSVRFDGDPLAGRMRGLRKLNVVSKGGGWYFANFGAGHDEKGQPEQVVDEVHAIVEANYFGNLSVENEQPGCEPEHGMLIGMTNAAKALYRRGEIHLPDAA